MADRPDIEELKDRGAGVPAPEAVAVLYREAFERFGGAGAVEPQAQRRADDWAGAGDRPQPAERG